MSYLWNLLWDLKQDRQIASNRTRTGEVSSRVASVDDRLERLMLLNAALWELLRDSTRLDEDDLRKKVEEIDLRDGKLDGKLSQAPLACEACGRNVSRRHTRCIYCGAKLAGAPLG